MPSIEIISKVSVYHLLTGFYAQTHVFKVDVYKGSQWVLFVATQETKKYLSFHGAPRALIEPINWSVNLRYSLDNAALISWSSP